MINRIIHQIWFTDSNRPIPNTDLSKTFRHYNPTYEYRVWSLETFTNVLLESEELTKYVQLFNRIVKMVEKADFAKHCIMYLFGGYYFDLDFTCVKSLETYTIDNGWMFCYEPKDRSAKGVYSGVFAGQQGHNFWLQVLDEMNVRYSYSLLSSRTLWMTGPILLHDMLVKYNNRSSDVNRRTSSTDRLPIISCCLFCPYAEHDRIALECKYTIHQAYTYTNWTKGSNWSITETLRYIGLR